MNWGGAPARWDFLMTEQDELDRRLAVIRVAAGVTVAALLVLAGLLLSGARAAEKQDPAAFPCRGELINDTLSTGR